MITPVSRERTRVPTRASLHRAITGTIASAASSSSWRRLAILSRRDITRATTGTSVQGFYESFFTSKGLANDVVSLVSSDCADVSSPRRALRRLAAKENAIRSADCDIVDRMRVGNSRGRHLHDGPNRSEAAFSVEAAALFDDLCGQALGGVISAQRQGRKA